MRGTALHRLAWSGFVVVFATACGPATPAPEPSTPEAPASAPDEAPSPEPRLEPAQEPEPAPAPAPEPEPEPLTDRAWVEALLHQLPGRFDHVLAEPETYRLQIMVTLVERDGDDGVTLTHHRYRVDEELLFPASCIKTVASIAALRKLRQLQAKGHRVDLSSPMAYCYEPDEPCEAEDSSNRKGGTITLGHEIRKMHLVSNNLAYNRLFDFVGHRELNEFALRSGLDSARLRWRMGGGKPATWTPRIEMTAKDGKVVVIPERNSKYEVGPTTLPRPLVGQAQKRHGKLIEESEDFGAKNHISIEDMHQLLIGVVMPEAKGALDFKLRKSDRAFLLDAMTQDPHASKNPRYRSEKKSALRYKLMLRGMSRVMPIEAIRYVNKPGKAYGFHLESAYVEDTRTGRGVFVTAGLYANANGITHDNVYEYDEITRPFFRDLGEVVARELLLGGTAARPEPQHNQTP